MRGCPWEREHIDAMPELDLQIAARPRNLGHELGVSAGPAVVVRPRVASDRHAVPVEVRTSSQSRERNPRSPRWRSWASSLRWATCWVHAGCHRHALELGDGSKSRVLGVSVVQRQHDGWFGHLIFCEHRDGFVQRDDPVVPFEKP